MKKYLLGLFAVVLAVGFSAFTAKKLDVTFVYSAPSGSYSLNDVQDENNWTRTESGECSTNFNEIACTIKVSDLYVSAGSTLAAAAPSLEVIATSSAAGHFVSDVQQSGQTIQPTKINREED